MTKVTLHYNLLRPLGDEDLQNIANVHSVYGMMRVQVAPTLSAITVDYDASRLMKADVEAVLMRYGIPIHPAAQSVA
jgi:copper chaperone CopZ